MFYKTFFTPNAFTIICDISNKNIQPGMILIMIEHVEIDKKSRKSPKIEPRRGYRAIIIN